MLKTHAKIHLCIGKRIKSHKGTLHIYLAHSEHSIHVVLLLLIFFKGKKTTEILKKREPKGLGANIVSFLLQVEIQCSGWGRYDTVPKLSRLYILVYLNKTTPKLGNKATGCLRNSSALGTREGTGSVVLF